MKRLNRNELFLEITNQDLKHPALEIYTPNCSLIIKYGQSVHENATRRESFKNWTIFGLQI